jgi:HORMA domain
MTNKHRGRRGKGKGPRDNSSQPVEPPTQSPQDTSYLAQATSLVQTTAHMKNAIMLPQQSLSFMQIFLNAAIASVLYSRGLLRHNSTAFLDRCVADLLGESGPVTYDGLLQLDTQATAMKSQAFKILRNGQGDKADKILELLVRIHSIA